MLGRVVDPRKSLACIRLRIPPGQTLFRVWVMCTAGRVSACARQGLGYKYASV